MIIVMSNFLLYISIYLNKNINLILCNKNNKDNNNEDKKIIIINVMIKIIIKSNYDNIYYNNINNFLKNNNL